MKVSVSSYSFQQLFAKGILNQFTCIKVAKEMGFDGIEFVDILPHDDSNLADYAKKLAEEAQAQGLEITSYTFGADFLSGSDGDFEAEVKRVKKQISFAEILGAPRIRHDATGGIPAHMPHHTTFEDILPKIADGCRQVTEYAATKGIHTMVENHGYFCQDSRRVEKLVQTVAHENFSLLADMGNFLCVDEQPQLAISRVAPYVEYAHAKDFHVKTGMVPNPGQGWELITRGGNRLRGAIIGHGDVPVKQCLQILKNKGYNGYVAIEFEGMEDPMIGIKIGHDNLRRYIEELV